MILEFGNFEVDTDRYELRESGRVRRVEPIVFDLIAYLARHPHRVFRRDELMTAVWGDRVVSDATISTCVKNARKALGDSGSTQTTIKTLRGRGILFAQDVRERGETQATPDPPTHAEPATATVLPSLLVWPFRSLLGSEGGEHIAEAVTTELSAILTRVPLLAIRRESGRDSAKVLTPAPRQIHEELGISYLLEGHIRATETQLHVNVQLSETKSGFSLWAERFSTPQGASALDDIILAIIAKLEPQLNRAIYESIRKADGDRSARTLYLEASSMLALRGFHRDSFVAAAQLLRSARQHDPHFALAPSYLSLIMAFGQRVGVLVDRREAVTEAVEAAENALSLDNMDSAVLGFAGCALADVGQTDRAVPILQNAIDRNPTNGQAWAALGSVCLMQRKLAEAIEHLRYGIRISPLDNRLSVWGALLSLALMQAEDLNAALEEAERACQRDDRNYMPRVLLAAIHALRSDSPASTRAVSEAYRVKPDLSAEEVSALVGRKLAERLRK